MMNRWIILLAVCLLASLTVSNTRAQERSVDVKRWAIWTHVEIPFLTAPFNARGLSQLLEDNAFGQDITFLGEPIEYPYREVKRPSWTAEATYQLRPRLRLGGFFHQTTRTHVAGFQSDPRRRDPGEITLDQAMLATGPVIYWNVGREYALGVGLTSVWGSVAPYQVALEERVAEQEITFQRVGAVFILSIGDALLNDYLYVGGRVQYLYVGRVEIGPFETEATPANDGPYQVAPSKIRLDQLTIGPVVALRF